jgi:hypothetical protein
LHPDLAASENALSVILQKARRLSEDFDDSVRDLEMKIRSLAEWAPDTPHHGGLGGLLQNVGELTGVNRAIEAVGHVDELWARCGQFLSNLSDLLQTVSAVLGTASLLLFWAPGVGQALGTLSIVTAGGALAAKSLLYATGAKDEYGQPFVSRGELLTSGLTVGVGLAGAGLGATAAKAEAVAEGKSVSIAAKFAEGFDRRALVKGVRDEVAAQSATVRQVGLKEFPKAAWDESVRTVREMSTLERKITLGGRVLDVTNPVLAPKITGKGPDFTDVAGLKSGIKAVHDLPSDFRDLISNTRAPLDLRPSVPDQMASMGTQHMSVGGEAPQPVMGP